MSLKNIAVALAAAAFALGGCASSTPADNGKGDTTGQYIDDATVTAKVKTAIASDAGVKAATNVNVETSHGVVQLSGFADSETQASQAVEWGAGITELEQMVLSDAQTSGGLLVAVPRARTAALLERLRAARTPAAARIGEIVEDPRGRIWVDR